MADEGALRTDGLRFRRFDLHVHTPASSDFQDKAVTAEQIVQAAIDAGLDAIAITDHNSGAMIDDIKSAAEGTGLTIFPGVEVTVANVHVVALFDIDKTSAHVAGLLSALGIQVDQQGNIEAFSPLTVSQAAEHIKSHEGLAVLAHINANKGVMGAIQGKSKSAIIKDSRICAAEATDFDANGESATARMLNGTQAEFNKRVLATYQASDDPAGPGTHGHGLVGIGSRSSYFKVDSISIRSLRQCFLDPEVRITQSLSTTVYPHIDSIKITGGYFAGQDAELHPGLNTMIGGKGAGKSLLVELLRFALDKQPDVPEIRSDHDGKLEDMLKMYSEVEVHFADETGTSHKVTRQYDSTAGHPYASESEQISASAFPVLFLSQNEIIAIAQDSQAQLAFIDQFFNFQQHAANIQELERKLAAYDTSLSVIINSMRETSGVQKSLKNTTDQIAEIDRKLKDPAYERFFNAELKMKTLQNHRQQLIDAADNLDRLGKRDEFKAPVLPDALKAEPAVMRSRDVIEKAARAASLAISTQQAALRKAVGDIDKEVAGFEQAYKASQTAYQIYVRQSGGTHTALAKRRAELLIRQQAEVKKLDDLKKVTDEKSTVNTERNTLLAELESEYTSYTAARTKKFQVLQTRSGGRLKLKLYPGENKDVFKRRLVSLKRGSYLRDNEIEDICAKVEPSSFVRAVLNYLVTDKHSFLDDFASRHDIDTEKFKGLVDFLARSMELEDLLKLQYAATPQDRPEIEYNTGTKAAPNYRPLSQLSSGQKCTALLIIALSDGGMPVVIDQPEDSLDIKSVWEDMCLKVRTGKASRQFIFTTHNSSLAVASDSDKFMVIAGSADSGEILMAGSMDNEEMRLEVIKHLEGDKTAYKKKYVKYEMEDVDYTA